ncbi:hypothetical protein PspKH34_32450 [Parageobacillus sp. KH3-4]|nr:hypothetical protein PspKH34_32450 [Parageobacillus sp. KH3-4]
MGEILYQKPPIFETHRSVCLEKKNSFLGKYVLPDEYTITRRQTDEMRNVSSGKY